MMNSNRNDLSSWFEEGDRDPTASHVPISDHDTVYPLRAARHEPPTPPGWERNVPQERLAKRPVADEAHTSSGESSTPLRLSNRTYFYNGHDGGGAALLRAMTDGYRTAAGSSTATTVVELPYTGLDAPHSTAVRVVCVRADAMGAKVAMRTVVGESRLVVLVAQLDGVFHPRVPHAARFAFRNLQTMCPVHFMPFEHRWRSDLRARPSRRYRRAIAQLVTTIEQTRSDATTPGAITDQPASPAVS